MTDFIIQIIVYLACFGLSFYGLSGIDFAKMIKPKRVTEAQVLLILFSMALGYLVAKFLMGLSYRFYY